MSIRTALAQGMAASLLIGVAGCAALPGTGPSAGKMQKSPAVDVVNVTPALAGEMAGTAHTQAKADLDRALQALQSAPAAPAANDFRLAPGDTLDVTLWSYSQGGLASGGMPAPSPLGSYTVSADGDVLLPYIGKEEIRGLTIAEAQADITRRYAALRTLMSPSAIIKVASAPHESIIVTGALGSPKNIPWTPAGVTLAQALTEALGDGTSVLGPTSGEASGSPSTTSVRVTVLRAQGAPVAIPISVALEQRIALMPGDRVVVKKAPTLKVSILGGGVKANGIYGFADTPSLSDAIAQASGLDTSTANAHAVFVLRQRDGQRPVLYDFAWNQPQGLVASRQFPLKDGDLVYVAEAPIVSVQKVINLLYQVALPAQLATNGGL